MSDKSVDKRNDTSGTNHPESYDLAGRKGIHRLKPNAVGLAGILFLALAGAAPLTAMLGNVPFAVGFGNGDAAPGGFIFASVTLLLFSIGYVAMARQFTAVGGFYSFISHGIGRPFGLAAGWSAMAAYAVFEASLMGIFAYYFRATIIHFTGFEIPWPVYAFFGVAVIAALTYFEIKVSVRVLGAALIAEVLLLVALDAFVFGKGGGPSGISFAPLNPIKAFTGLNLAEAAPGVGIFFALWSWVGFEATVNYAEESRDPKKNIARATYIAVIGLGIFYTLTSWAVILGHGLTQAPVAAAAHPVQFFYSVANEFTGWFSTDIMRVLIVTSSFACGMAFHNAATRYFYSLGREGVFHRRLGHTHKKWQSPHVASLFQSGLAAIMVLAFILFWISDAKMQKFGNWNTAPYTELYAWLAILGTFWIMTIMALCSASTISYFWRLPREQRPPIWQWLIAPALGGIGLVYAVYLLWVNIKFLGGDMLFVTAIPYIGVAWILLGLGLALYIRRRKPEIYKVLGRLVDKGV